MLEDCIFSPNTQNKIRMSILNIPINIVLNEIVQLDKKKKDYYNQIGKGGEKLLLLTEEKSCT